ncbi:restriction endonuclease subunit S [Nostoc sp. LPT]|uniref:restriction endonuclease subunit S n=1 Tax=Nostoc sp. LPT TaxID=2815387 RepID=UPI001D72A663|nr:restriction endonuclease subunit S [Nostoc sp. LPT]MBN4002676.1 restriction endonuclease subunit S [Nostoc sp. LPT]
MGEIQLPYHWKVVKLNDISLETFGGGTPSTKQDDFWDGCIPWTTTAVFTSKDIYLTNYQRSITEKGLENSSSKIALKGSVLIGTRVGLGKAVIATFDVAVNQDITVVTLKPDILSDFFVLYFKSFKVQSWISDRKRGTTIQGIPRGDVIKLPVPLPPLPEQKTIAHTLRTIQKAKEPRQRELELERERKAALMQYLFTHGTGNEPRKQTEIGEIPQSWELVRLDSLVEFFSGGTPAKNHPEWWQGNIPWVSTKDLKQARLSDTIDHISKEGLENGSRLVSEKTLLVAVRGMCLAKNIPVAITEVSMAFNQDIKALVPSSKVEAEYLLCAIQYLKDYLLRFVGTSAHGTKRLPTSSLKTLQIPLPKIKEQQLIAITLKACDRKIQALEKEIALTDELFHAMLEQLMTGKISTQPLTETYV